MSNSNIAIPEDNMIDQAANIVSIYEMYIEYL